MLKVRLLTGAIALMLLVNTVNSTLDILSIFDKDKAWYPEENSIAHWTGGDFKLPCSVSRKALIADKNYVKSNAVTTRLQLWADKVLAVFPRYKKGVPVTFAIANLLDHPCTLEWQPFPCWSAQKEGTCDAIQNAVDVVVDLKDQVWILDSGIINTIVSPKRVCPPKIIVVHIPTHKVMQVIDLSSLTDSYSRLQYLQVDHSILGQTYIYISDAASRSILVWDVIADKGWRVKLPHTVLDGPKDVFYLSLVHNKDLSTSLYFTYLSSSHMFYINTDLLRQKVAIARVIDVGKKPDKMIILGTDGGTKIFFRYEGKSKIYEWNTISCFKPSNFEMVYKGQNCRLATHVVPNYLTKMMMVLESNFPDFIKGTVGCGASHTLTPMVGCVKKVKSCLF